MKHSKNYLFILLLLVFSHSNELFSSEMKKDESQINLVDDDNLLKVKTAMLYGTKVLQISFDGEVANTGLIQIKNSSGNIVENIQEAELIRSPYSFSMDISAYKADTYTVILVVNDKTYTSVVEIK